MASMWHPTLLLFVAISSLPVFLFFRRRVFSTIHKGFWVILGGAMLISVATFLEYLNEIPTGRELVASVIGHERLEISVLYSFYLLGVFTIGAGWLFWFPAIHRTAKEIERRELLEEELHILLEESRKLTTRAEEASRYKSEFLATMGHELRTPLNAIIGFADLMQQQMEQSPEKREEYLAIVADSGRHLLSIINDILDMSKLESGRVVTDPEAFYMDDVVGESVSYLQQQAFEAGVSLSVTGKAGEFHSDRRIVKQILINILSNAVKFTPSGGRVEVHSFRQENTISIAVSDTGVGMSDDELVRAMKPFVQVDNGLSRNFNGTGLGLPLVDRFCNLLGGSLFLRSAKGEGTVVTITLPDLALECPSERKAILELI